MNSFTRPASTAFLLISLLAAGAYGDAPEPPFTGVIIGESVNVRAMAGDNYYVVLQLNTGDLVEVLDERFGWYQIVPPEDSFSYISKAFVDAVGDGTRGVVNANRVRVRAPSSAGPSQSYRTQVTLNDGARVTILDEEDGYYRIVPPEGADLSVSSAYVEPAGETQLAQGERSVREQTPAAEAEAEPRASREPAPAAEPEPEADRQGVDIQRHAVAQLVEAAPEPEADRQAAPEPVTEETEPELEAAPEEETTPEADPRPLVSEIAVHTNGAVEYDGQLLDGDALGEKLAAIAGEFDSLTILAAREAPSREVFGVLDQARSAGIDDLRLGTLADTAEIAESLGTDPAAEPASAAVAGPELALGEALESVDAVEPSILTQDVSAERAEEKVADEEPVEQEPLTFDELERRYASVSEMPLRQQPIGELRMDYEHLRVTGELSRTQRRLADARIELLSMRQELQASLLELSSVEEEVQEADRRRAEEDAARPREYAAVGRLTTSTLYTGERLPLLYRVIDPLTGRTVAYVQPASDVDPINLIDKYVGVEGRRDYDGALGLYVVTASNIDELSRTEQGGR